MFNTGCITCAIFAGTTMQPVNICREMEKELADKYFNPSSLSPAFFEAALSAMSDYVYAFNREGGFVYVNKTMQGLFGNIQLLGKTFADLDYPQELADKLNSDIDKVFQSAQRVDGEVFYTSPTGKSAWFNYSWSPMLGADGTVELLIGSSRDMTERHELDIKLRESEQRLAAIIEALPVGVAFFDTNGEQSLINKEMERFLPNGKMPSKDDSEYRLWKAHDETGKPLERKDFPGERALRGETVVPGVEMLYQAADGKEIWTRVSSVPIKGVKGNIIAQVTIVVDIDKSKRIDGALRDSEQDYRLRLEEEVRQRTSDHQQAKDLLKATMDSSLDMIQVFQAVRDEEGKIVDFIWVLNNKTSETYYGDVIGKSLRALNPGVVTEGIFETFKNVVETGKSDRSERHYEHEQFKGWFYQSAVKLGDGVATTTTDITERKKAEQNLIQITAEQQEIIFRVSLQALEEERRRISESLHNGLGQVLYGVKISLSGLNQQQSDADFQKTKNYTNQLLSEAIRESRRISHELMPTTLEEFGLDAALHDICEQLNGEVKFTCKLKGLKVRLERYLELAVYRTVQELMTNVVKHARATRCSIEVAADDKNVNIRVRDNGKGIDAAKKNKPGIGLASIRSKIKLLNGHIEITGSQEKGTLVEIEIPLQTTQMV